MDTHIMEEPTAGILTLQSMLKDQGIKTVEIPYPLNKSKIENKIELSSFKQ